MKKSNITKDNNIEPFSKQNLEIVKNYLVNTDYNFLAFAYTPWHLLGIRAVMEKLISCGTKGKGIILICKNQHGGYILNEDSFADLNAEILPLYLEEGVDEGKVKRIFHYINSALKPIDSSNNPRFFLISPNEVNLMECSALQTKMPDRCIINYTVDEGLATYMRQKEDFFKVAFEEKKSFFDKLWLRVRLTFLDRYYENKLINANRVVDYRILRKEENKWKPNSNALPFYQKSIIASSKKFTNKDLSYYSGAVVINTQPFAEEGMINHDEDIQILFHVVREFHKLGHKIVIKFHPREKNLSRYSSLEEFAYFEEDRTVSQESLLASLHEPPFAILGFSSTTLISASLFFEIPTISLAALWDFATISEDLKLEQERFLNTFSGTVPCPHSYEELFDEIRKIKNNKSTLFEEG